ncbi:hypothetical protein WJX81_001600 [Elliptochloris bilobata]|uniref:Uncharacterized protein n=1 Tax=Elliptochloris bilobata TaxID=381761 RepID=A0AAW1QTN2_9CHLO
MHNPSCQRTFAGWRTKGAGRANGEPHEEFNACLNGVLGATRYIRAENREAAIERAAAVYDGRRERTLPELLIPMHVRALADVEAAGVDIARMEEALESLGYSKAQAKLLDSHPPLPSLALLLDDPAFKPLSMTSAKLRAAQRQEWRDECWSIALSC